MKRYTGVIRSLVFMSLILAVYFWSLKKKARIENKEDIILSTNLKNKNLNSKKPSKNFLSVQDSLKKKTPKVSEKVSNASLNKDGQDQGVNIGFKDLKKKSKNSLSFQVKNNYLVVSEDILLGKLPDESAKSFPKRGEIPADFGVEIWRGGEIPYAISESLSAESIQEVQKALEVFHQKTYLKFVPYSGEKDAIYFTYDPDLCASFVGKVSGHQPILLNEKCKKPKIIHEIMHALGFIHEQQRYNRDEHLRVNFNNILEEKKINFEILPAQYQKIYKGLSSSFDYKSVTLYDPYAFAIQKEKKTLEPKRSDLKIEPSKDLSQEDLSKIEEVYFRDIN